MTASKSPEAAAKPKKIPLKSRVTTKNPVLWSPKGDRFVTLLDYVLTVFAEAGRSWTTHPIALEGVGAYAWRPDGTLAVVELGDGDTKRKATVVLLGTDGAVTSRFDVGTVKVERGQSHVSLAIHDGGQKIVVYDEANGTRVYALDGKKLGKGTKAWASYSPDGQLSIDEDGRLVDDSGNVRFTVEGPFAWLNGNEVLVFQASPTPGMDRVAIEGKGKPKPERVFACDKPIRVTMGPRGDCVGLAYREGRIDVYALPSGKRTRSLPLPKANNSGLTFDFAPDGRMVVGVEWEKAFQLFGSAGA